MGLSSSPKPPFHTGQAQSDQFPPNIAHCAHISSLTLTNVIASLPWPAMGAPPWSPESTRLTSLPSSSEVPPAVQRIMLGFCDMACPSPQSHLQLFSTLMAGNTGLEFLTHTVLSPACSSLFNYLSGGMPFPWPIPSIFRHYFLQEALPDSHLSSITHSILFPALPFHFPHCLSPFSLFPLVNQEP